ncbi:MAG: F0F1 ATP synthase subunit delta [Candidatus Obscuribacterales bacterium]|nr:F0F1 ATP synthase subunit delta [Candidatus Obscuribacterales bacterium]
MLIDWFTVIAQILNFLILIWLMKRFLYKPILAAIDSRENKIAGELLKAEANMNESQKEKDEYRSKIQQFEETRAALLAKAQDEAKIEYDKLMVNAHKAADECGAKRREALAAELAVLSNSVSLLIQKQVFALARKTLSELSTSCLEENICRVFIQRLEEMDEKSKDTLINALRSEPASVVLHSAFEMSASSRQSVQDVLNKLCNGQVVIKFEVSPALVAGIELQAKGQCISWSIEDYLSSLEKSLRQLILFEDSISSVPSDSKEPATEQAAVLQ